MSESKIEHPSHYGGKENPYECIKVLEAWLPRDEFTGFLCGNKDNKIEDLKKQNAIYTFSLHTNNNINNNFNFFI